MIKHSGKFQKGDKVLITKGTVVYERGGKQRIAGRNYVVTVHRCTKEWLVSVRLAYNDRDYHGRLVQRGYNMDEIKYAMEIDPDMSVVLEPARIVWSGSNGWCEADAEGIELYCDTGGA
jgi:hypothetical protein